MEHYFYLDPKNTQVGPFSVEQIKQFVTDEKITPDTFIWADGEENWLKISEVPQFQDCLKQKKIADKSSRMGCLLVPLGLVGLFLAMALISTIYDAVSHRVLEAWISKTAVSEAQYGSGWPLTVSAGKIYKREYDNNRIAVIFVDPGGYEYGLNGTAQTMGYADIHGITKFRTLDDGTYLYESVGRLIDVGLKGDR